MKAAIIPDHLLQSGQAVSEASSMYCVVRTSMLGVLHLSSFYNLETMGFFSDSYGVVCLNPFNLDIPMLQTRKCGYWEGSYLDSVL